MQFVEQKKNAHPVLNCGHAYGVKFHKNQSGVHK
jgi:hypothetical protein